MQEIYSSPTELPRKQVILAGEEMEVTEAAPVPLSLDQIDFSRFEKKAKEIRAGVMVLIEYASLPIIEDTFVTHSERLAWEQALLDNGQETIKHFLDQNKLGINQIASVLNAFENLDRDLQQNPSASLGPLTKKISHLKAEVDGMVEVLTDLAKQTNESAREDYRLQVLALEGLVRKGIEAFGETA